MRTTLGVTGYVLGIAITMATYALYAAVVIDVIIYRIQYATK